MKDKEIYGPGDDNYGRDKILPIDFSDTKELLNKIEIMVAEEKLYTYIDEDGIEKEICVLCGEKTKVPTDRHIDFRDFYIEGVGQLCYECGKKN